MIIETHPSKKRINIIDEDDSIAVKLKHIPIFLMMLQKHYGEFSEGESFGKHEVVKRSHGLDTIVRKIGKSEVSSKYAIGNYDNGDRLYGLEFDPYITVTEESVKELILQLADYYIKVMNEEI
jgi:hypothetical protein